MELMRGLNAAAQEARAICSSQPTPKLRQSSCPAKTASRDSRSIIQAQDIGKSIQDYDSTDDVAGDTLVVSSAEASLNRRQQPLRESIALLGLTPHGIDPPRLCRALCASATRPSKVHTPRCCASSVDMYAISGWYSWISEMMPCDPPQWVENGSGSWSCCPSSTRHTSMSRGLLQLSSKERNECISD